MTFTRLIGVVCNKIIVLIVRGLALSEFTRMFSRLSVC